MATTTTTPEALIGSARSRINRFETVAWRYMRWSGILLVPLAFIHLAIMHLFNSVYVIDLDWVIQTRWSFVPWRVYDAFLLWFAGLHGFNGLRTVINDYATHTGLNRLLKVVMILVMLGVLFIGTVALVGAPFPAS
jgi:succinate dehydrogenase / fumarate reductase membrane anchor subunit